MLLEMSRRQSSFSFLFFHCTPWSFFRALVVRQPLYGTRFFYKWYISHRVTIFIICFHASNFKKMWVEIFLSLYHKCFIAACKKKYWVNVRWEYVCLIRAVVLRPLLGCFWEVGVDIGFLFVSCPSSTWACSWTWTTSSLELFRLLCFTD